MTTQPHPIDRLVGQRVRDRRKSLGLSQAQLAEACDITFQQVQKYERGANRVSCSRLVQISDALDVAPAWFLDGLGEMAEAAPEVQRRAIFGQSHEMSRIAEALAPLPANAVRPLVKAILSMISAMRAMHSFMTPNEARIAEGLALADMEGPPLNEMIERGLIQIEVRPDATGPRA